MKGFLDWVLSRKSIEETNNFGSIGLLIFRVSMGSMMAFGHGLGKLTNYSARAANFADPLGVGSPFSLVLVVFSEFFCALAVVLGLFTRGVVIPLIINMTVAGFVIHGADPFGRKEKALLYLASFIILFFTGPGKYSLDRLFRRKE